MSLLPIIIVPDPVLRQKANPVQTIDDSIRKQTVDMFETMHDAPGIGLAANQVGLLNRVIVMHVTRDEEDTGPLAMVNPEIIWKSEELSNCEEGCLSIPGYYGAVERPARVRVRYQDPQAQTAEIELGGLASHCVQHEIDHLDGVLFIDYLSSLRRNMILRKLKKDSRKALL